MCRPFQCMCSMSILWFYKHPFSTYMLNFIALNSLLASLTCSFKNIQFRNFLWNINLLPSNRLWGVSAVWTKHKTSKGKLSRNAKHQIIVTWNSKGSKVGEAELTFVWAAQLSYSYCTQTQAGVFHSCLLPLPLLLLHLLRLVALPTADLKHLTLYKTGLFLWLAFKTKKHYRV